MVAVGESVDVELVVGVALDVDGVSPAMSRSAVPKLIEWGAK